MSGIERVRVVIERVAHGGHCVARHEGRVLFVRHALPGETVEVEITGEGPRGRYLRADAVAVVDPSPARVTAPCPHAGPGRCGGCDWQHASLPHQRELKAEVLREQLTRLGGMDEIGGRPLEEAVTVEAVPGDLDGLGWRTRVSYAVDDDGRVGLRRHRSHEVEPVQTCLLVTPEVDDVGVSRRDWPGVERLDVIATGAGDRAVIAHPGAPAGITSDLPRDVAVPGLRGRRWVRESAGGRDWRVDANGFWQVHPGAADALVAAVREALRPRAGEHLLDLYAGVGLFAGSLAGDLGPEARIDAVEASARACADARRNLHDLRGIRIHERSVASWMRHEAPERVDLVVLDPPRSGAGAEVMAAVLARQPRAVAYVACDPAALGRDLGQARAAGWQVVSVRGLDLFPMTQHVEAVALLEPAPLSP